MCYSGLCFYERQDGSCRGRNQKIGVKPACMDQEDWDAAREDWDVPEEWERDEF
jgi:hypothetical protein